MTDMMIAVPHLPTLEVYTWPDQPETVLYEVFTFRLLMLPSVNRKHAPMMTRSGPRTRVTREYRNRELEEIARIIAQRELVKWPAPRQTDRYIIGYLFPRAGIRQDLHNPVKPTCDLLGAGRYERRGKKRVFVPHAQLIWNDNRVVLEIVAQRFLLPGEEMWATIMLVRFHVRDWLRPSIPTHQIVQRFLTHYVPPGETLPSPSHRPITTID